MRDIRVLGGGGVAAATVALLLYATGGLLFAPGALGILTAFLALLAGIVVLVVAAILIRNLLHDADWLRSDAIAVALASVVGLVLLRNHLLRIPDELFLWFLLVALGGPFLLGWGFSVSFGRYGGYGTRGGWLLLSGGTLLLGPGIWWLFDSGPDPYPRVPLDREDAPVILQADPGMGRRPIESLTYGSGEDPHREEFGARVDIRTEPVDLGPALPEWAGFRASHREWWWGFGISDAPVNGRVHLPRGGAGERHPVALIVHGNHAMEDFSDDGYGYLTGMLASMGIVGISVDSNFLNGTWSGDFGGREMPARGILLLEHLAALREMDMDPDSPLYQRLDLDQVALVGHSRGGEAAAIAAVFNDLDRFPDRAGMEFDYGFGIRAVVAIAQIDRRYSRRMFLEDKHFLAIHGSYDTDEPSFHGLRQYHRVRFSGEPLEGAIPYGVKAGILLHGGNHGQFNSTWGMDSGLPGSLYLNRTPLVSEEDQQQVARSYLAAFLRVTLLGETEWLPLLRDYRAGTLFLPDIPYQNQYADGQTTYLATFEEDLDLVSGTAPGIRIEAEGFSEWGEEEVMFRDGSKQATSAVRLRIAESVSPAFYELQFPEPQRLDGSDELVFSVTWTPGRTGGEPSPPLAMSVELVEGDCPADIPVETPCEETDFQPVAVPSPEPAFEVRFLKSARMNRVRYRRLTEPIPQARAVSLRELTGTEAEVFVRAVRFSFGGTVAGDVLLDDIGWRRPAENPQ